MKKQIISMLLIVVMLLGLFPTAARAEEPETAVDNSDITVTGENGFGTLLAEDIADQQAQMEEEQNAGYSVTDLEITGNTATVTYASLETATLVVAIYTEDGMQLLTSGKAEVIPEETVAAVTIEGEMPQYFTASAYLLDSYDLSPLCKAYDTVLYTKDMQDLLNSTAEDYDQERVLQLEESPETNFAVYAETTKIIEPIEGVNTVVSADDETNTYVIENADESITTLREGDVAAYPYGENELLIVKVASVAIEGTTATITGVDVEMEEVFSHVKLEGNNNTDDFTVDDSDVEEGVTYEGSEEVTARTRASNPTIPTINKKFKVEIKGEKKTDTYSLAGTLKASISINVDFDFSYYVTPLTVQIKFVAIPKFGVSIGFMGSFTGYVPLPKIGGDIVPGVLFIGLKPKLIYKFTGEMSFSATITCNVGVGYDNKKGATNLSTKPKVDIDVDFEGTFSVGIDLAPTIEVGGGKIAKLEFTLPVVGKVKANIIGTSHEDTEPNAEYIHSCKTCIAMDIGFEVKLKIKFNILNSKKLSVAIELASLTFPQGNMYYSLDHNEFGYNTCPYLSYRVTVQVKSDKGTPVSNASVTSGTNKLGTTNSKGVLVTYLPSGSYELNVITVDNTIKKAVKISKACLVSIVDLNGNTGLSRVIASGKCGANVFWELLDAGVLRIYGSGAMDNFAYYRKEPWIAYYDRIKTVIIESGVTTIGEFAFTYCNISSISLPDTLTSIADYTFWYCVNLQGYWVDSNNPVYSNDEKGVLFDKNKKRLIRAPEGIKGHYSIPDSVTCIDWEAFRLCANLTSVTMPNDLTTINPWAFNDCTSLTSVTFSKKLKSIGYGAFWNCKKLSSITLPDTLTSLGKYVFWDCDSLISVTIPKSVTYMDGAVFSLCDNLQNIWVDENNTNYSSNQSGVLFDKNKKTLITVPGGMEGDYLIPEGIVTIGVAAFYGCSRLTSISIPSSVTSIEVQAFRRCGGLSSVTFYGKAPSIASGIFAEVSATVYYPANDNSWTSEVMQNYSGEISWVPYAVEVAQASEVKLAGKVTSEISKNNAVFSGENSTDTQYIQTASFTDLVPGEEYVMLSLMSIEVDDPLVADNLLYIDQAVAAEDGSLSFQYIQRADSVIVHVIACGASNRDLVNAEIFIPNMQADGETQVVQPTVIYGGITLTEGVDYVLLGDVDFTEAGKYTCYIRGIYGYTGLLTCTYTVKNRKPASFRWEMKDNSVCSVMTEGNIFNNLTLTAGSISNGTFTNAQYSASSEITLRHDSPWIIEWKSTVLLEGAGVLLFSSEPKSKTEGATYIYIRKNGELISFGEYSDSQFHNYGISPADYNIDNATKHIYTLENRIAEDGSNMVYLSVDHEELGALNRFYINETPQNTTSNWISGKDFSFSYMGTDQHPLNGCSIEYIQVWEGGVPGEFEPQSFRWETIDDKMTSVATDGNTQNDAYLRAGSCTEGVYSASYFKLEEPVVLLHDQQWSIEWQSEGDWRDVTNGALLLSASNIKNDLYAPYIYRRGSNQLIAFGERNNGQHHNYGISLDDHGIDGTAPHVYRLENRIDRDGSNMVYLYVDGEELGALNNYYIGGTAQGTTSNWISGKDFTFTYMGTEQFPITDCSIGYLQVCEGVVQTANVEFRDWDDSLIDKTVYKIGDTIIPPVDPVRETDGEYIYNFAGWDKEITTCSGDVVFYAVYEAIKIPTISLKYPSLSFEDVIIMNVYYTATDIQDVVEMGLITNTVKPETPSIETADAIIPGYGTDGSFYFSSTEGIAPKDLGDTIYFAVYAKLADGTYTYTTMIGYSPKTYALNQLTTGSAQMRPLVAAMLNYGAAAQNYFSYKTDSLVNATMTEEQKAMAAEYSNDMIASVTQASGDKLGQFVSDKTYTKRYPTITFEGAFCINYYFQPTLAVEGDVTMYIWSLEDYEAVSVLTKENATKAVKMELTESGEYLGVVDGIAAKDLDKAAYVSFVYSDGTTEHCGGVIAYTIGMYCKSQASKTGTLAELAKACAVYGYYAKQLFG